MESKRVGKVLTPALIAFLSCGMLGGAEAGFAQEPVPPEVEPPRIVDEITVTAQKREENLQDVPIALTVFSADQIEDARIQGMEDLIALVPNMSIAHSFTVGNSLVAVRGLSQLNNSDSPIAVVVDGVYQGNQKQLIQELFDVERIEVLRGPQGALYGRNSLGGVLNIVTRQPTGNTEGHVAASAGNGLSLGLTGAVGGTLPGGRLQFRFAGSYKDGEGLIENVYLGRKADPYTDRSGRLQLKFLPTDALHFDLRIAVSDSTGGAVLYSVFPTQGFDDDFRFAPDENILGFSARSMKDYSLRTTWATKPGVLTAILGVNDLVESYRGDADFSNPGRNLPFPLGQVGQGQDLDLRLVSQEVRWTSRSDTALQWTAGLYALETDRSLGTRGFIDTNGTVAGFAPFIAFKEEDDNTAYAGFGHVAYDLSARWNVAGALRYDEDRRRQRDLTTRAERSRSFADWQPKVTVSLQAREDLMAYLSLGTGFRSGGFNAPAVTPSVFPQETSTSLELGCKSTLWGRRLRVNGAAYSMRVKDAQYFRVDPATFGQLIDNIAEADIRGLEVDAIARLGGHWDVFAAAGLNDAKIDDFDGSARFVGNQMPSNTRWKTSLGAQYTHPLTQRLLGIGRLDAELRGRQYWFPDNLDVQEPLQLFNARLGVEASAWKVMAWAKNLTDQRYYVEYVDAAWAGGLLFGSDLGQLGPPRSYGIEISRRF